MHHVPSYLEKPDDTFIPSKVVQPASELKIDITSLETIDSEWAKSIPSRLLQKLYVVHKKNVTLYRGIDVRPGMIFFPTRSFVFNPNAAPGDQNSWAISERPWVFLRDCCKQFTSFALRIYRGFWNYCSTRDESYYSHSFIHVQSM